VLLGAVRPGPDIVSGGVARIAALLDRTRVGDSIRTSSELCLGIAPLADARPLDLAGLGLLELPLTRHDLGCLHRAHLRNPLRVGLHLADSPQLVTRVARNPNVVGAL
jgi:hypothetical protein